MHTQPDDYIDVEGFSKLCSLIVPFGLLVSIFTIGVGYYLALYETPTDPELGDTIRIMHVHVSAAWLALFGYTLMALSSFVYLLTYSPVADLVARNSAPLGAAFTLITLITGSLWAKPAWGVWWTWDARLTSVLILLFLYLGYMAIINVPIIDDNNRKLAAIISIFGAVNLPVIKFSVEWWSSMHPKSRILSFSDSGIDPSLSETLIIMTLGFLGFFMTCLLLRMQATIYQQKWRQMQLHSMKR